MPSSRRADSLFRIRRFSARLARFRSSVYQAFVCFCYEPSQTAGQCCRLTFHFSNVPEWWNLADALRSGRSGLYARGGSSPPSGTNPNRALLTQHLRAGFYISFSSVLRMPLACRSNGARFLIGGNEMPEGERQVPRAEYDACWNATAEAAFNHTVGIVTNDEYGQVGRGIGTGTAVLWKGKKSILTAKHVVRNTPIDRFWFFPRPEGSITCCEPADLPSPEHMRGFARETLRVDSMSPRRSRRRPPSVTGIIRT